MTLHSFLLETDRLLMRLHQSSDAAFMVALNSDPDVVRYTGDRAFNDLSEAEAVIRSLQQQFADRRMGRFIVIEKASGKPIGWCGLKWHEDRQVADIGYRFLKRVWGRGYATEVARACLEYGFNELGLERIIARSDPENAASLAVIGRLGMTLCGQAQEEGFSYLEFESYNLTKPS